MLQIFVRGTMLHIFAARLAFAAFGSLPFVFPAHATYRLGVQDRVRIQVNEWQASLGEIREWKVLTGEFTIGPDGALFLPLIGELEARGLTTAEVALAISKALQGKAGLKALPDTSVEVVQFRPFYILGKVARPGAYPFQPGLTVLQSVSLAGGIDRASDQRLLRIEREIIAGRSSLNVINQKIDGLLARKARLQAELDGDPAVEFPPELALREKDPIIAKLLADEQLLFETRRQAVRSQTESLQALKQQFESEINSLKAKVLLKEAQLKLVQKEVEVVTGLVKKGLAIESRQFSLESAQADVESGRLDLNTAILRAQQEISKAERTMLELQNQFRIDVITELRRTGSEVREQWEQSDAAQKLLIESEVTAADAEIESGRSDHIQPIYSIARKTDGKTGDILASEFDPVEPGDVVRVRTPVEPASADARSANVSSANPIRGWQADLRAEATAEELKIPRRELVPSTSLGRVDGMR